MVKKVRLKFLAISMFATFLVTLALILAINLVNIYLTDVHLGEVMREMSQGLKNGMPIPPEEWAFERFDGRTPFQEGGEEDTPLQKDKNPRMDFGRRSTFAQYQGHFFQVFEQTEGGDLQTEIANARILSDLDVSELMESVKAREKDEGYLDGFRYLMQKEEDGIRVSFLDCSTELSSRKTLWLTSLCVGAFGLLVYFLFIAFMTEKSIQPLRESMEKQKQFITDAGHELKTPLSVIATDIDVLSMDLGRNEWVDSIKRQVVKSKKLVEHLISLSRMDEGRTKPLQEVFCISDAATECADTYSMVAETKGKDWREEIEEDLYVAADTNETQQLFTILCDNALKYASGEEPIVVRLKREGKRVFFETENGWNHDTDVKDLDKLFDRFYRGDKSRDRSGGKDSFGLGLSIAKAIADRNHLQLKVSENAEGHIVFRVTFPLKKPQ